jgi:hypothetical protein
MVRALRDEVAGGTVSRVHEGIGGPVLRSLERRRCVGRIADVLDGALSAPGAATRLAA